MNPTASDVRSMSCTTTKTPTGWLAVSTPYSPVRIGVVGQTEDGAREAFREAAEEWARLREIPDAEPAGGLT
jgi:hypothetical protein